MFTLRIKDHFDAAHKLINYKGACSNLHGHTWQVEVFVQTNTQDKAGISVDFKHLKKTLQTAITLYDHAYLNNYYKNPTAENISKSIYKAIEARLRPIKTIHLKKVRVWESINAWCEYEK